MKKDVLLLYALMFAICNTSFQSSSFLAAEESNFIQETHDITSIIEDQFDEKLGNEESSYIKSISNYSVTFDIPKVNPSTKCVVFDNKFYISTQNIVTSNLVWEPKSIIYNGINYNFEYLDGNYFLYGVPASSSSSFEIKYKTSYIYNKEEIDKVINAAYEDGEYFSKWRKYDQYSKELLQYNLSLEQYNNKLNQYNKYLEDKKVYEDYLIEKRKYDQYVKDLDAYYDDLAYATEDEDLVNAANHCLDVMDICFTPMELIDGTDSETRGERRCYDSIMGSSVSTVISERDKLEAIGAPSTYIDKCKEATEYLRKVLPEYNDCLTRRAKYHKYLEIYRNLYKYVYQLFRYLEALFRIGSVETAINSKNRLPQYQLLIAQLAYFAKGLAKVIEGQKVEIYNVEGYVNDNLGRLSPKGAMKIDDKWTFRGHTLKELIGKNYTVDTSLTGEPPNASELPILASSIIAPTPVENPSVVKSPKVVEEPVKPIEPKKVEKPINSKFSSLSSLTLAQEGIANAYENSLLHSRIAKDEYSFSKEITLSSLVEDTSCNVVLYYDEEGKLFYTELFDDTPSFSNIPSKAGDSMYIEYVFDGWKDNLGENVNLSTLNKSIKLYPSYHGENPVQYNITWIVDGKSRVDVVSAGRLPKYGEDPSKEETDRHFYIFKGWDKEIGTVTGNETYTAVFEEHNKYKIEFVIEGDTVYSEFLREGVTPLAPEITFIDKEETYLVFQGWNYKVGPALKDVTYIAQFVEKPYLTLNYKDEMGNDLSICVKEEEIPESYGALTYYDYNSCYTFIGWNRIDNTLLPRYIDTSLFSDKTKVKKEGSLLVFDGTLSGTNSFDLSSISKAYANLFDDVANIKFSIGNNSFTISKSSFLSLLYKNIISLSFEISKSERGTSLLKVGALDQNGQFINSSFTGIFALEGMSEKIKIEGNNVSENLTLQDGNFSLELSLNEQVEITSFYQIKINQNDDINCSIVSGEFYGDLVDLSYILKNGVKLDSIDIISDSGKHIEVADNSFIMPNENVTIIFHTSLISYLVNFYVDDKIIYSSYYHYNEQINLPDVPFKESDENYTYEFIGWLTDDFICKGNIDIHANFLQTPIEKDRHFNIYKLLIFVVIAFTCCILGLLLYIIIRSIKRKKNF